MPLSLLRSTHPYLSDQLRDDIEIFDLSSNGLQSHFYFIRRPPIGVLSLSYLARFDLRRIIHAIFPEFEYTEHNQLVTLLNVIDESFLHPLKAPFSPVSVVAQNATTEQPKREEERVESRMKKNDHS